MPRNRLPALPFPPLAVLEQDTPLQAHQIRDLMSSRDAGDRISLLLRSKRGHPKRGGYYFHFTMSAPPENTYHLYDFQKHKVASLSEEDLVLLINHCSGRDYSERAYMICQNEINLRDDSQ